MKKAAAIIVLILLCAVYAGAVDRMNVKISIVSPNTVENRQRVGDILKRAVILSNRRYEESFIVEYDAASGRFDYTIEVLAALGDTTAGIFTVEKGGNKQTINLLGDFNDNNVVCQQLTGLRFEIMV